MTFRFAALALLAGLAFPALAARQAVDDAGHTVALPVQVQHIAEGWYAHQSMLMVLGVGDQVIATVNRPENRPWMYKVSPGLSNALLAHGTSFDSEALLARHTDVVFVAKGNPEVDSYRQAGLPTLEMAFTDYPSMKRSLRTTAETIGTQRAIDRATAWSEYLDDTLTSVTTRTSKLTQQQRPTVLHIQSLNPLRVDGSHTLIDTWITAVGGRNAAAGIEGNMKEISPEMVLYWQPEVIILGSGCGDINHSQYAALFAGLNAVKNGKVWHNPAGVFPWDRYGAESALQLAWAARMLHPEIFNRVDIVRLTQDFYRRFFDYGLTRKEARRILAGQPPAA
ncbi:ABC transporter substrate-binding protein [Shimwellia pseudoproteus]|uniref:ABC transporter substrate-binding protein n=1 Tax=Shimwellia pseudoproteus TaxID=570012 RepID=UPI0018EC2922|nr:ABC transporter substrate-binding protein [Shimwellia pseudoproteus]MBJ3814111.1 ABC transporter substrate-binding protein [Shimwellia pseudoproteus]